MKMNKNIKKAGKMTKKVVGNTMVFAGQVAQMTQILNPVYIGGYVVEKAGEKLK